MKLQGEAFTNSDTCHGTAFVAEAPLDMAEIVISGRYPQTGWARNRQSHEMVRVLHGAGSLALGEGSATPLAEGDVIHVPPDTWFAWEGDMTMLIVCSPPFSAEQYEIEGGEL